MIKMKFFEMKKINKRKDNAEYDKKIIELCKLRQEVYDAKSLMKLVEIINNSSRLKTRNWYSKKLNNIPNKEKYTIIRRRVLQTIDGMIAKEVMKHYKIVKRR